MPDLVLTKDHVPVSGTLLNTNRTAVTGLDGATSKQLVFGVVINKDTAKTLTVFHGSADLVGVEVKPTSDGNGFYNFVTPGTVTSINSATANALEVQTATPNHDYRVIYQEAA